MEFIQAFAIWNAWWFFGSYGFNRAARLTLAEPVALRFDLLGGVSTRRESEDSFRQTQSIAGQC